MLKIKDDVDLKELEKFGFEYKNEHYKYQKSNFNMTVGLNFSNQLDILCDDNYYDTDIEEVVDWIYDLIQAGLVEKV